MHARLLRRADLIYLQNVADKEAIQVSPLRYVSHCCDLSAVGLVWLSRAKETYILEDEEGDCCGEDLKCVESIHKRANFQLL